MAQPEFVPVATKDEPREGDRLPPPERWVADRPGETVNGAQQHGDGFGSAGPDQGYALFLARRFDDKLQLASGEHKTDVVNGCLGVATKRASLFGRGPVIYDWELAFTVWGFLGGADADLVSKRRELFAEASHHYWKRRAIADAVPEETLRLTPAVARTRSWAQLLTLPE
jgi:hypothetical protein